MNAALVAGLPPVMLPVTDGTLQLYKVPSGTMPLVVLVVLTVNDTPLQLTVVISVITAVGLIVTVNVNAAPVQSPDNGVTMYVAVCITLVGFVKLPLIVAAFVAGLPPVIEPVTDGALQLYKVPAGTIPLVVFVGLTVNSTPLQLTAVMSVITAVGLIVTVNVNVVPVQIPVNGVTI